MEQKNRFWLALMVLSMLSTLMFAEFAGGTGTQDDPWQVATAQHLNNVRNYVEEDHQDKFFIQTRILIWGFLPTARAEAGSRLA
ncbi:MAG: hypothetical protein WCY21_03510 [Candidatus Cloacimonadaceae bacterium]|jgi:hypothetical protein|nr:hypothetical protein [Candidatus Cloacimonadota bacterium]MDX9949413.1 hypothetical protein [Candidatus Syntrophosphaera sp.]NLN85055.1 hypothetical protein [Candidatus Cloacimonadota bacterium]